MKHDLFFMKPPAISAQAAHLPFVPDLANLPFVPTRLTCPDHPTCPTCLTSPTSLTCPAITVPQRTRANGRLQALDAGTPR